MEEEEEEAGETFDCDDDQTVGFGSASCCADLKRSIGKEDCFQKIQVAIARWVRFRLGVTIMMTHNDALGSDDLMTLFL